MAMNEARLDVRFFLYDVIFIILQIFLYLDPFFTSDVR